MGLEEHPSSEKCNVFALLEIHHTSHARTQKHQLASVSYRQAERLVCQQSS
jgi:hypothetical protein